MGWAHGGGGGGRACRGWHSDAQTMRDGGGAVRDVSEAEVAITTIDGMRKGPDKTAG